MYIYLDYTVYFPLATCPFEKCLSVYAQEKRCPMCSDHSFLPLRQDSFVVSWLFSWTPSELYTSRLGSGDPLRLALTNEFALCLSYIAEQLQDDIRDQRSR